MAAGIKRESVELNIEIDKGSTFRHTITWQSGENENTLTPVDLTNCTASLVMRSSVTDPTVLEEFTTANGDIVLGDAAGTIELLITAPRSSAFSFDKAVYGLEITFPNGDVKRVIRGQIIAFNENVR